jgi:hypothetical protein
MWLREVVEGTEVVWLGEWVIEVEEGVWLGRSVREGAEILVWEVFGGAREVDESREISARRFGWLGG